MVGGGVVSGGGPHVARAEPGVARRAQPVVVDGAPAAAVLEGYRRPAGNLAVLVAPLHQGHHGGPQVKPLVGEVVGVALGRAGSRPRLATAEGRLTAEATGKLIAHATTACLLIS